MSRLTRNIAFSLVFALLMLMPACGNSPGSTASPGTNGPAILVTDSIGREVEVPEKVDRIAALYSFVGYAVCLFGSGNELVGVPGGLQRDKLLIGLFPAVANASVPRSGSINIEELLRIKPDLVIVRRDTVTDQKEVEKLESADLPYIVVDFTTMEEQRKALLMIGKAIGKEDEARRYDEYFANTIARVSAVVEDIPREDRMRLFHAENQATRATHETSLAADWTKAAGVVNVSVGQELDLIGNDYYAGIEQILLWNPEVIIVNETAAYNLITGHPQWSGISAVQSGKVYQLPNGISRWGHPGSVETPLALLWTAKTVYPDRFTDVDMYHEVRYYYKTFFNMDLSDDMIAMVLKGGDLREPK